MEGDRGGEDGSMTLSSIVTVSTEQIHPSEETSQQAKHKLYQFFTYTVNIQSVVRAQVLSLCSVKTCGSILPNLEVNVVLSFL